jgi:hypothetical protein
MTTRYEITVRGRLSDRLVQAFDGLTATPVPAGTVLSGELPDQAALHGVLARIESLGLELLDIHTEETVMSSTTQQTTPQAGRKRLVNRLTAGAATLAAVAAVTVAVWPASEAEKAYDDGHDVGVAVSDLYYADSSEEVDQALADLDDALVDTREHAGDAVYEQADKQADALDRAVDGYVGATTSSDDWDQELYEAELEDAVDDLQDNAEEFQTEAPEVEQSFWDGVDDGLEGL